MKLSKFVLAPIAAVVMAYGAPAQAQIWDYSFQDIGVDYSLSFDSLSGNVGTFTLTLDTSGYNHHALPAYLHAVDLKAWSSITSFTYTASTNGWAVPAYGPTISGPNAGCQGNNAGFACIATSTDGLANHLTTAGPFSFTFEVTGSGFNTSPDGGHVGAGYAAANGNGASYGLTSHNMTTPIPEPEIYAMLGLGLGLMGWVGRRRKQQAA
jgi:hypothetical protein